MPLSPKKRREMIFQILYAQSFHHPTDPDLIDFFMKQLKLSKRNVTEALVTAEKILGKISSIDPLIEKASKDYRIDRISKVQLTILRLAIFEMFYDETIPPEVAITEGIRLSQKFGSKESSQFINAVLDNIFQEKKKGD